ncbi:GDP-mannose 4,6-dehydratase [Sulfurimonas hongkongensis]|nr:GDP-mannose 4,6-dehydratase [Sulfurimonas hongkongensis]
MNKQKVALITGITGQDGSYLAEFLLKKGYEVHGIKRRSSLFNTDRIDHLYQDPHVEYRNLILHFGDMTDSMNLTRIIQETQPDEIYNLAAMSHVAVSFETPEYVANADGTGTLRILEAVKLLGLTAKTKIYQASTSELYGKVQETPQSETTPFYPRSPYAVAKIYAYWITVRDFVKLSFEYCGIKLRFEGIGVDEVGIIKSIDEVKYKEALAKSTLFIKHNPQLKINQVVVCVDPRYFRPTEVDLLLGDPSKAERKLGWSREFNLQDLVNDMMKSDLKLMTKDVYLKDGGYNTMSYYE